ncbi:MAG: energy-coupling factor transporter transmembrane protein EcfT [Devosia sp.]|nr:energy-coupling factor transporter transmembrane protein EcfT [Devosia sp.]
MSVGVYVHADSVVHRLSPGIKLAALFGFSTLIVLVRDVVALAVALGLVLMLFPLARLPLSLAWRQWRPILVVMAILAAVQLFYSDWVGAVSVVLRLSALVLLAALVSLTTKASDMIEAISRAVRPLAYLGISPTRIGLVISLALRFIPLIAEQLEEVKEAQRARGLERNVLALTIPLMVRVLKMATEIGDAIEARSFDPDDARRLSDLWRRRSEQPSERNDH